MASIFNNFLKQVATGDQIRDFRHASRLFVDNNYALSPKHSWLFHVFIDVNPEVSRINDTNSLREHGMLVKSAELPKFTVDTKTYNSYNRPNLVQTKIKYDSVTLTFHDDQSNVINSLWYDYYNYYYRDTDTGFGDPSGGVNPNYYAPHKYNPALPIMGNFGYTPRSYASSNQYIKSIQIYSLYQKKFSLFVLVNPMITAWNHGTHTNGENGILENSMTLSYESVLYGKGYVTQNTVKGFADLHYDKAPSPLTPAGGGTNSIMGPGGILNVVDEVVKDGIGQNYGAAAFKIFRGFQKNKNVNLAGLAKQELVNAGLDILNGKDPRNRFFFPTNGNRANSTIPTIGNNPNPNTSAIGKVLSNGNPLGTGLAAGGAVLAAVGNPKVGAAVAISGLLVNSAGLAKGAPLNQVVQVDPNGQVQSAVPAPNPSFFGSVLAFLQKQRSAKVTEQNRNESQASNFTGDSGLSTLNSQIRNSPVFQTGTNLNLTPLNTASAFQLTPNLGSLIPANNVVAAGEAEAAITSGNPQTLTDSDYISPKNNTPITI